jgi:excisionase family DNA binding protein
MMLTPDEAAKLLKVHKRTLLEWLVDNRIPHLRISKKTIRIPLETMPISQAEKDHLLGVTTPPAPAASLLA